MTSEHWPHACVRPPLRPTLARYFALFWKRRSLSVHRVLEYEALERVDWGGDVLDIGGGKHVHYMPIIERSQKIARYESINMDPAIEPTYIADLSKSFDMPSRTYDMVVSLNTLEHLRKPEKIINKIPSVLAPGGQLVIVVPFLIRVHASPYDYIRLTATWWIETLAEIGFDEITVEPLVWDPISSAAAVAECVGPFRLARRLLAPIYGLLYAALKGGNDERYSADVGERVSQFALAYLVKARYFGASIDISTSNSIVR